MCCEAVGEPDVLDEVGRVREADLAGPVVERLEARRAGHEMDAILAEVGVRLAVAVVERERPGRAWRSPRSTTSRGKSTRPLVASSAGRPRAAAGASPGRGSPCRPRPGRASPRRRSASMQLGREASARRRRELIRLSLLPYATAMTPERHRAAPPTSSSTASRPRAASTSSRCPARRRWTSSRRCRATRAIRHITTRHEQGAAFMADVYGRLTGRAAVAMATLGPGATNLLTGIADAFLDRAPMVAITGQAASDKLHKEAHQVVDIVGMFEPVTKWNTRVERIAAIPEIVRKAFRVATLEKPGPDPHRAARGHRRDRRSTADGDRARAAHARARLLPRADRRGDRPRRAARSPPPSGRSILAGNGVLRRRAAPELRALARGPARAGRRDVHGQGRDRRSLAPVADGRRAPGARPRAVRLRPGGPRHLRRLRPRRVRAVALEPGRRRSGSSTSTRSRPRSTRRTSPRSSSSATSTGRCARLLDAVAAAGRRRARARPSATSRARSSSTPTCAPQLLAELDAHETTDGWPITPQRAIVDLRRALGPGGHRRVATSAPTRSGSRGCTRRTSRTP